jgi:hypothetical protein
VKLARLRLRAAWQSRSWGPLLEGFRANLKERDVWRQSRAAHLCPILLSDRLGFFVIMPHARALTDDEFESLSNEYIEEGARSFGRILSGDFKRENYGMLGEQRVKIDYEA